MTDATTKALEDKCLKDFKYDVDSKVLASAWPAEKSTDTGTTPNKVGRPQ